MLAPGYGLLYTFLLQKCVAGGHASSTPMLIHLTIFHKRRGRVSFRCSINKSAVSLTTAVASRCMGIYIVPTCINDVVASPQGGCVLNAQSYIPYSGIEMTRMIELGQKSKPRKNSRIFNITPQKSLDQKFNPQKVPCRISEP